jgi:hypothetical protein
MTVKVKRSKKETGFYKKLSHFQGKIPPFLRDPSSFLNKVRFFLSYQDKEKSLAKKKPVWPPHGLARNFLEKLP